MKSFKEQTMRFWTVFSKEEAHLRELCDQLPKNRSKLRRTMKQILDICMSECAFTIDKNSSQRYVLTLSPKRDHLFILYLRYVIDKAPTRLCKYWDFYYAKQKVHHSDYQIEVGEQRIGFHDLYVFPHIKNQHIYLDVYINHLYKLHKEKQLQIAYEMMTACIGEIDAMYLLQGIRIIKRKKAGSFTLDRFPVFIKDLLQTEHWINVNNPLQVYSQYTILPRRHEIRLRDDMYSGVSTQLQLIHEMVHYDDTHIRWAEANGIIIGFIFYEHLKIERKDQAALRENLEERITKLCADEQIAENIGVAGGIFYSYLDYVVYDWERFLQVIPDILDDVNTKTYGFQYMISGEQPLYVVNNVISGKS